MNRRTVPVLVAVIVGLLLMLLVLRGQDGSDAPGQPLLPDFKAVANDTTRVTILGPDADEALTLERIDDAWVVGTRDNYAADVGKLRPLIIALADASILEEKTSDPALYEKLGLDDPESGGSGSKVTVAGPDFAYAVILGNTTQGKFRYARDAAAAGSYLIDQDPELPLAADDWLLPDLLDIGAARVRQVRIAHADGETIALAKDTQEQTDFSVLDIPAGRELSYATVANGIAGVLGKLQLSDVRRRVAAPAATTVEFDTWDELRISAEIVTDDEDTWVSFTATGGDAEAINARLGGWQYQLPEHKTNLLTRRWDDLLKGAD